MDNFDDVLLNGKRYIVISGLSLGIDPTDELLYLYNNGVKQGEGIDIGGGGTRYTIQKNLTQATLSNTASGVVEGKPYVTQVVPDTGRNISTVSVQMGGNELPNAYDDLTKTISVASVTGNLIITVATEIEKIDLLNVTWANHAITCGQPTNRYNAWSPHNLQYDDVNDCFVFLQCHCSQHLNGTYTNWTLSIINPYDSTDFEDITIPSLNGLGMLFIENGVWTLLPIGGANIYRSSDKGETWETISATVPGHLFGVYKCGDTYFAGNDSNTEITYYKSDDLITWETVSFDSSLGYSILCETTFCEFDGKYWAFNRTNDATLGHPVILQSTDKGETWTLFSDQMLHGFRSTVSCLPFKNYIVIADIDRDNGYLYYSKFDGTTITELNSWTVQIGGDDFHNVNIATNYEDTIVLEFMHSTPFNNYMHQGYRVNEACDNVMIVGSTKALPSLNFDAYLDTREDFVSYANSNLKTGINGNSVTWTAPSGAAIQATGLPTTFVDEIEVPLNLLQTALVSSSTQFYLMEAGEFVWPWQNELGYTQQSLRRGNISSKFGFVTINNNRYMYFPNKYDALPVLFKVNSTVPVSFTQGENENDVVNQSWQETLGFRRVILVNLVNNSTTFGIPNNVWGVTSNGHHAFSFISYTPVSQQAS